MAKYKRVLIKLSGEALGDHGRLFDFDQIDRAALGSSYCAVFAIGRCICGKGNTSIGVPVSSCITTQGESEGISRRYAYNAFAAACTSISVTSD